MNGGVTNERNEVSISPFRKRKEEVREKISLKETRSCMGVMRSKTPCQFKVDTLKVSSFMINQREETHKYKVKS